MSFRKGKRIGEFDVLTGELLREFVSVTEASKETQWSSRYIIDSCKRKRVIEDKYYRYLDKDGNIIENEQEPLEIIIHRDVKNNIVKIIKDHLNLLEQMLQNDCNEEDFKLLINNKKRDIETLKILNENVTEYEENLKELVEE